MDKSRYLMKIKCYNDCLQYTYSKVEMNRKFSNRKEKQTTSVNKTESIRCSISRSIAKIKDICLTNRFDYFFTLTIKDDKRNDVLYASKIINNAIKHYGKTRPHFKYLYVFEKQKKGGIHIHGFFSGFDDLYYNNNSYLSSVYFDKIGFQCFKEVKDINPFYLIKYISKEPIEELKHRYYRSKNLNTPKVEYLHCDFNEFNDFCFTFKNKYCKMITVSK